MNQVDQTKKPPVALARAVDVLKSVPGTITAIVGAVMAILGLLAIFWQPLQDRIHPPAVRSGTITEITVQEQMTLKNYLAYLRETHTSNSILDGQYTDAQEQQLGSHVQFRVDVVGYMRHRCEIDYAVLTRSGSALLPEQALVAIFPAAVEERGMYDVWIPESASNERNIETLAISIYDDSPRPPGHMLDAKETTVAWE